MNNGGIVRIILPVNVFMTVLDEIGDKYDEFIKTGMQNFLCTSHFEPKRDGENKLIFFEKVLPAKSMESDLVYARLFQDITSDVIRNKFKDLEWEDYEVTLPCSQIGGYVSSNFISINPTRIAQHEFIAKTVARDLGGLPDDGCD